MGRIPEHGHGLRDIALPADLVGGTVLYRSLDQMGEFGNTSDVPRQLVLARKNLDRALVGDLKILLAGLDESGEGHRWFKCLKKTTGCDAMPTVR